MTKENETLFKSSVYKLIHDIDVEGHLEVRTATHVAESITAFCENAIAKFIKGQLEHGGKLEDRDLDKEITLELLDLFWYNEAKKWKGK